MADGAQAADRVIPTRCASGWCQRGQQRIAATRQMRVAGS